jgi:adenylate cyclase
MIWQTLPGAVILYVARDPYGSRILALYERRNFRFTRAEATQLVLGLCIPVLIADHVLGTRVSLSLFGTQRAMLKNSSDFGCALLPSAYAVLLLVVWIHGCLGFTSGLVEAVLSAGKGVLLSLAVLLPALRCSALPGR